MFNMNNSINSLISSLKIANRPQVSTDQKTSTAVTTRVKDSAKNSSPFQLNDIQFQRHQLIRLSEQSSQELLRLKKTLRLSFNETNVSEATFNLIDNFAGSRNVATLDKSSKNLPVEFHGEIFTADLDHDDFASDSTPAAFQTYEFTHYTYGQPKTSKWNKFCKTFETVHPELAMVLDVAGKQIKVNRLLIKLHSTCTRANNQKESILKCTANLVSLKLVLFALTTGQLFLRLDNVMDILRCCCELRLQPLIRFFDKLSQSHDPIFLLLKLRESVVHERAVDQESTNANSTLASVYDFDHENLINTLTIRFAQLLRYPGTLDLTGQELEQLLTPRLETEMFLKVEPRCEYQTFRFILNWYRSDSATQAREDQAIRLLELIRFDEIQPQLLPLAMDTIIRCLHQKDRISRMLIKVNEQLVRLALKRLPVNQFYISPSTKTVSLRPNESVSLPDENHQHNQSDRIHRSLSRLDTKKRLNYVQQKIEHRLELVRKSLKSCKSFNVLGSRSLISSYPPIHALGPRSYLLLFGGFSSQIPYLSDQGKIMYHLQALDAHPSLDDFNISKSNSWVPKRENASNQSWACKNSLHLPSILTHEWVTLMERLPRNLAHFAHIKLGHYLFIFGGIDLAHVFTKRRPKRVKPTSECYCLDIGHSCWYRMKNMKCARAFHAACLFQDHVYVFGGLGLDAQSNLITLNTLERFDLKSASWRQVLPTSSELPSPRMAFGMIKKGGLLWLLGGIEHVDSLLNFKAGHLLQDVWSFSPSNKQFQQWPNIQMKRPRAAFGCLRSGDRILVLGGVEAYYNEELLLQSLDIRAMTTTTRTTTSTTKSNNIGGRLNAIRVTSQVISLHLNQGWRQEPSMCQPRIFPCAVRVRQHLYVIGGKTAIHFYLGSENLAAYCGTYEMLNQRLDRWIEVPVMFSVYGAGIVAV